MRSALLAAKALSPAASSSFVAPLATAQRTFASDAPGRKVWQVAGSKWVLWQ
jgi:hypothetical protein